MNKTYLSLYNLMHSLLIHSQNVINRYPTQGYSTLIFHYVSFLGATEHQLSKHSTNQNALLDCDNSEALLARCMHMSQTDKAPIRWRRVAAASRVLFFKLQVRLRSCQSYPLWCLCDRSKIWKASAPVLPKKYSTVE